MVGSMYVPERGDIIWIDFSPQLGHEQRGRRPALVISHRKYNEKVGLGIFCPITSKSKDYPFEVKIDLAKIKGSVLCDQLKSLDWTARNTEFIETLEPRKLQDVIERVEVLIK
jgi:mRNA interferase MazF